MASAYPSDLHYSTDNHEIGANGRSMFDSITDIFTKGIPLTGLSVYNSFVNTAVDIGNFFGGEFERNEPIKQLQGFDDDLLKYYKEHSEGIEAAGLITGSIIPGTAAVKALKLASMGKGADGIAKATGLFAGKKQAVLDDAMETIMSGKAGLFPSIEAQKFKAIAYGFGDQALQAAAWEVATIATMKANPLLDKDGFGDVLNNVFWGTLVGGGVGGVIEGIVTKGVINKLYLGKEEQDKIFELARHNGIGNFNHGDYVADLIASIDNIPVPGTPDQAAKLARTRAQAEVDAMKILKEISPNTDDNLGKTFIDALIKMRQESKLTPDEMYDYLGRLARISRPDQFSHVDQSKVLYTRDPNIKYIAEEGTTDARFNLFTRNPAEAVKNPKAYVIHEGAESVKIARFDDVISDEAGKGRVPRYTNKNAAFDAGEDIFIDDKLFPHINPNSRTVRQVARPGESRILTEAEEKSYRATGKLPEKSEALLGAPMFFNVLSGRVTDRVYALFGDLGVVPHVKGEAQLNKILSRDSHNVVTGVKIGDYNSPHFSVEGGYGYHDLSALDANARYVWARARGIKEGEIINYNDLPLLEELARKMDFEKWTSNKVVDMNLRLRQEDGTITKFSPSLSELQSHLWVTKDGVIKELLGDGSRKVDVSAVAIKANVPESYIEKGLQGRSYQEVSIPVDRYLKPNTIKLEYDIGDLSVQEGNILRGMIDVEYRVNLAKQQALNATYNFFKEKTEGMLAGKYTAADSNTLGAGARGVTSASAEYGTLAQRMETMGAQLTQWMTGRHNYVSDRLSRVISAFNGDDAAAAELAVITNIGRRVSNAYVLVPQEIVIKEYSKNLKPGELLDPATLPNNVMALNGSIKRGPNGEIIGWNDAYMPSEGNWVSGHYFNTDTIAAERTKTEPRPFTYYQLNSKVYNFLQESQRLNDERLIHHNNWLAAQGDSRQFDIGRVYFPPVDTSRYSYVAIVRDKEGRAFGTSDAAAIISDSLKGLQDKVSALLKEFPDYRVNFKENTKDYHKAVGDYDYSLNLAESVVDSNLRKRGILSDIQPNLRGETILKEHFDWHIRQEDRQARNFMELGNAQLFEELRVLGRKFTETATSRTGGLPSGFFRQVEDPFDSYIKTALNISPRSEYRLWNDTQQKIEAFGATAFRMAKEYLGQADKGLISYEEATKLTTKFGLGNPYERTIESLGGASAGGTITSQGALAAFAAANRLPLTPVLSQFIQKANSVIAATNLRLDLFQTLINVVSTPVLQIAEYTSVKNGGLRAPTPGMTRLFRGELVDQDLNKAGSFYQGADKEEYMRTHAGRWFSSSLSEVAGMYGTQEATRQGITRVKMIDIPTSEVERYNSLNHPNVTKFGGDSHEYILPDELLAKATDVTDAWAKSQRLSEMLTMPLPGTTSQVPAYSKAIFTALGKVQGEQKGEILALAERLGTINNDPRLYYEMLDNLTINPSTTATKLEAAGKRAVELGVRLSRSDWGEQFTRLVSTSMAKDLFEALGHTGKDLDDHIRTFVNRVHGNYIASQRPVAFQGPIGQAMGLFQTYQFNLLQNLFRYVENKEKLPIASLFAMQGTLFGLQGIPGFQALNTHIVGNASANPEHKDFYSTVPKFFNKEMGDWLLYGSVSNILQTGLYSRGDINPRQLTVLPVNPLDFPAIGASIKFVKNLVDMGQTLKDGGKFSDTMLQGMEHNGLSRPLTGIAQVINGYSTTSKGNLISASNDWDGIAYASRILGSRPLDEAIAMDALYRKTAYSSKDTARITAVGEAFKTTVIANGNPTPEQTQQFAADYAAAGGRIEHFGAKMIQWTRDANEATANKIYRNLRNPLNQNMMKIMGGDMLPDYTRIGPPDLTAIPQSTFAGPAGP